MDQDINIKFDKKEDKVGLVVLAVFIVVVLGIGIYVYANLQGKNISLSTPKVAQQKRAVTEAKISITRGGFVPATVNLQTGDRITWVNRDKVSHRVVSDPHPAHSGLPDLDSDLLEPNDSFTMTLEKPGTFIYHLEENPKLKGTMVVK